ncbi:hypothetical protein B0H67DRAFT_327449 [Lasiosphaeris hirsuta]|uniref:Uncharacterized protein n=1 Tax=Lasiosphaeris hirsuta TaxID=260670 RepID=A0AA40A2L1_9PEZI|nr:hypothetical protein B0H67DRAFT_327449 [Lasiosphaeris hirsuta]
MLAYPWHSLPPTHTPAYVQRHPTVPHPCHPIPLHPTPQTVFTVPAQNPPSEGRCQRNRKCRERTRKRTPYPSPQTV